MAAGTVRRLSMRDVQRWFSTETPIQMLFGQGSREATSASRSDRLVRTWNVCQLARSIVSNTAWVNSSGTSGWKRSDIEFTKISRGRFHSSGWLSRSGRSWRSNPRS